MPNWHFKDLVVQAKKMGADTISIFGYGEPLCDPKIAEKVKFVSAQGLDSFITTNASLLSKRLTEKLIEAGLSHIRFSVHGLRDTYENVHRGLRFDTVIKNIRYFLERENDTTVSVSVIPMHNETVESIRDFWEYRTDYLEIWKPHNWTDGRSYREVKKRKKTCGRPFNGPIQINADGTVMICCFDFNGTMTVGDTYKNTLEDIIKGDEYNSIREKHDNGDLSGLICATCDQLNEGDTNPLLYSNRDPERNINVTSSTKFKLEEN